MTESEQLTEGSYVYTDLGIEQVHWCEVNGEKELVTPKGYILGDVLDFDTHARLVKNNIALELGKIKLQEENNKLKSKLQVLETSYDFDTDRLEKENAQLKELLKECREYVAEWFADRTDVPFRQDKPRECVKKIDQVLGDKTDE